MTNGKIVALYILFCLLIVPAFPSLDVKVIFARWAIFAFDTKKEFSDLYWTVGKQAEKKYFLKMMAMNKKRVPKPYYEISNILKENRVSSLNKVHKQELRRLCNCRNVQIVRIRSSFSNYFIFNTPVKYFNHEVINL